MENNSGVTHNAGQILTNPLDAISRSRESSYKTVKSHFGAYLKERLVGKVEADGFTHVHFAEHVIKNQKNLVDRDCVATFLSYLEGKVKKVGTLHSYMSTLKSVLEKEYGSEDVLVKSDVFSKLRRQAKRDFIDVSRMTQQAPEMKIDDLKSLCKFLFRQSDYESFMYRALFCLHWALIGRVAEIAALKLSGMKIERNGPLQTVSIELIRYKTSQYQRLLIFPNPRNYLICPLHALAVWLMLYPSADSIFPSERLPHEHAAKYVNTKLKDIGKSLEGTNEGLSGLLTSHSARSGAATYVGNVSNIDKHSINIRGGWQDGSLERVNLYLRPTSLNDARVGRVLSEWEGIYLENGGKCLFFSCLPDTEKEAVNLYSLHLFGPSAMNNSIREVLTIILLMHYNAIKSEYGNAHIVIVQMERVIEFTSKLPEWSTYLMAQFKHLNSYCTVDEVDKTLPILSSLDPILQNQQHHQVQLLHLNEAIQMMIQKQNRLEELIVSNRSPSNTEPANPQPPDPSEPSVLTPAMFLPHTAASNLPPLKDLEAHALFELWYTRSLFTTTVTKGNKDQIEIMKRVVAYSKCLLPPDTEIETKPTEATAIQNWHKKIRELSKIVKQKWLELRRTYETDRKKEIKEVSVWSVKKLISQIEQLTTEEAFHAIFPFPNITDRVTPPEFRWENYTHRKFKRQRIN